MRQTRELEYTIKVYGEGLTEWFYFDRLRNLNRFRFSLEPDMPKSSRSSYKQNLKLIEKELRKKTEERADAIFLVIDTDTITHDKDQYRKYQETKEVYKAKGVTFIESYPCIELWFLYHLTEKFARTNYETFKELEPHIQKVLDGYNKTEKYYQSNSTFRSKILNDLSTRAQAINFSIQACKYEPVAGEMRNYTEVFKAIHFFRLLKKFSELKSLLGEILRTSVSLRNDISDHKSIKIFKENQELCRFQYKGTQLRCICQDGTTHHVDDTIPLSIEETFIKELSEVYRTP